ADPEAPTRQPSESPPAMHLDEAPQPATREVLVGRIPGERHWRRTAIASMMNVTRSATRTVPPGPPRYGRIPKSVCFTVNVVVARTVSGPRPAPTISGTFWD